MCCLITVAICVLILVLYLVYCYFDVVVKIALPSLQGKHVVITGGSSGIGKCVAKIVAHLGANVTIIARNLERLDAAKKEVLTSCSNEKNQKVTALSMDVTQSYESIKQEILSLEGSIGAIYMFVNCAGFAECATIVDATESNFRRMLDSNLLGTMFITKVVAEEMVKRRSGVIVVTSSLASFLGIYGLGAYCASKWALRGFTETLCHEMKPHNISVTLCLPPDTDTPGFENENKDKPEETKLICESGGIFTPEVVAQKLVSDALRGRFYSIVGFEGNLLSFGSSACSPYSSISEVVLQVAAASLVRIAGVFNVNNGNSIISSCQAKRDALNRAKKE